MPVALIVWKLVEPSWRRFAGGAALMLSAMVLAIAPWTVRNAITMHAFIPVASGLGHTFLAGHQNDPYAPLSVFPEAKITEKYSYLPYPEREIKVEREALRQGLDFAKSHPGYEVQLVFEKAYNMYRSDDDALAWIGGGWIDASKAPWLQGSWVQSLDKVGTPVVTIPKAAERNWRDLANWLLLLASCCWRRWRLLVVFDSRPPKAGAGAARRGVDGDAPGVHSGLALPRAPAAAAGAMGGGGRRSRVERRERRRTVASCPALARRITREPPRTRWLPRLRAMAGMAPNGVHPDGPSSSGRRPPPDVADPSPGSVWSGRSGDSSTVSLASGGRSTASLPTSGPSDRPASRTPARPPQRRRGAPALPRRTA